jgi:heme oxygenase (mycobilin-producing)
MAIVTALLDLKIKPESVAEAKETVEGVLVATRAFPGCLGVDVLVDTEDKAHLLLVERWESLEHDQAYRDWRATPAGASALGSIVASRNLTRFVAA